MFIKEIAKCEALEVAPAMQVALSAFKVLGLRAKTPLEPSIPPHIISRPI